VVDDIEQGYLLGDKELEPIVGLVEALSVRSQVRKRLPKSSVDKRLALGSSLTFLTTFIGLNQTFRVKGGSGFHG
jgi:hypothetical protein